MSVSWVRKAIAEKRLKAVAWEIGTRRTYRVKADWLQEFLDTYRRGPDDL